jgi:hypothetical protein
MKSRTWIYLLIGGVFILLFVVYRYGFEDRYLNIATQTAVVDLSLSNRAILIEKHKNQKTIVQLELRIRGKLSDNITLHLSEDGINSRTSIRIKNGKIDTSFLTNWSREKAYILIENPDSSTSQLEIEYQFVSNN